MRSMHKVVYWGWGGGRPSPLMISHITPSLSISEEVSHAAGSRKRAMTSPLMARFHVPRSPAPPPPAPPPPRAPTPLPTGLLSDGSLGLGSQRVSHITHVSRQHSVFNGRSTIANAFWFLAGRDCPMCH